MALTVVLFQDIISSNLYYTVNRGILADILFPAVGTSGTQTLHIKKPFHITEVSTLVTIPCENDCQTMLDCLNDDVYSAISCYLGTFDKAAVEHLLKMHKLKELARNVKNEKEWLEEYVQAPHKTCAPLQGLESFKELIFNNSNDKVVLGKSVLSEDLATLTCQRWLNINVIGQYADILNSYNTETRTFILNRLIGLKAEDLEELIKTSRGDICKYFTFIVNVGTKGGSQYVGTPLQKGCHWVVLYVDTTTNEYWYIETPWDGLHQKTFLTIKQTCGRYLAHKTSVDDVGRHKCLNSCYKNIPLQDCASVCGVIAVVIASLICLQPNMWASCFLSRSNTLPDSLSWLTRPSTHSSYLRRVLIEWIMHGEIDTSALGFSHANVSFKAPLPTKFVLTNNFVHVPTTTSNIQAAAFKLGCSNPVKKVHDNKENEHLPNNEKHTTENCKEHLPEISPSSMSMEKVVRPHLVVKTQEKKEGIKSITQAKSKITRKTFKIKKPNGNTKNDSKENEHSPNKQSHKNHAMENCKEHLSEISPSSMTVPQEKREDIKFDDIKFDKIDGFV
ncbi:Zinc finger SWIM domain-containing 3 [Paramuricea clavata]|uniref:Zinc finger SWIM domain-containing 3, partial n=1 Tax=Paramuricea clavata TaxID=317549 RepID=A0A6S7FSS7_PARCT|nr:Zinc finger SWIM domain-containing 3 [Paramuricea clavata]